MTVLFFLKKTKLQIPMVTQRTMDMENRDPEVESAPLITCSFRHQLHNFDGDVHGFQGTYSGEH